MLSIVDTHQHLWDMAQFSLPWLALDGEWMKQIGLRKLDTEMECDVEGQPEYWEFDCGVDEDELEDKIARFEVAWNENAVKWMEMGAKRWSKIDRRCTVEINDVEKVYTMTRTLRA